MIPPPPTLPDPAWIAVGVFVLAAVVAVIGWFVVNALGKRRELQRDREAREHSARIAKENRNRFFLAFLDQWHWDISSAPHPPSAFYTRLPVMDAYRKKIGSLQTEAAKVRGDVTNVPEFNRLVDALGRFATGNWDREEKKPREAILEAMDALIGFVENAGATI
jgi:hypothetical protein